MDYKYLGHIFKSSMEAAEDGAAVHAARPVEGVVTLKVRQGRCCAGRRASAFDC